MKNFGQATAPGAATTAESAGEQSSLALIIVQSTSQPHRVGEVAFFPPGEPLFVGRGDGEAERFACFARQVPGEVFAVDPVEGLLGGESLSRRQLEVRSTGDALEVAWIRGCRTYFNGQEGTRATLRPGDTVRLRGEAVLLCVSRPRELPALQTRREIHPLGEPDRDGIVGEGPAVWRSRDELERAARGQNDVLIEGESGTGKEMAAAVIHRRSSRARGPFVSRNASTISPTLIASELFGNPAGYPNPGMPARKGLVGTADKGTLFLDEIGDCSLDVQAQLLRVMDDGECQAVGEAVSRQVDVRFVGATNRDESVFRSDFHARFLTRVRLPPLRERREDIPLLARHFLLEYAKECTRSLEPRERDELYERLFRPGLGGRLEPKLSDRFIDELLRLPLPGNARDLQRLVIQAAEASHGEELRLPATATGATATKAAPTKAATTAKTATPLERSPRDGAQDSGRPGTPSKEEILACLEREEGKVARAARRLGVDRNALYRLMKSYGIDRGPQE
ncbi:MAG: sigma 54-interacting transcriptional regulator [Polyangiaceae bacterium]